MSYCKLLIGAAAMALLTACVKDHDGGGKLPADKEEATPFDFATSKKAELDIRFTAMPHNARVDVYTQNPLSVNDWKDYVCDEALRPIVSGYTDAEGRLSLPVELAAGVERLYAYSPSLGAPVLLEADATSGTIRFDEHRTAAPRTATATRAEADTKVYWTKWNKQHFNFIENDAWSWSGAGRPAYLTEKPMKLDAETLNRIENAIPKGEKFELIMAQRSEIEISEDANVSLYFVSNSSARRNALAYFTYTSTLPSQEEINRTLTVLFPNLSTEALAAGEGVMLAYRDPATGSWSDRFPAGVKIGFVLLVDAWKQNGKIDNPVHAVYSHKNFNSYEIKGTAGDDGAILADRPHMAAFKAGEHFVLTFEDLPYMDRASSKHYGDFSDNVFVMTANPIEALPDVPSVDDSTLPPYVTSYEARGILAFEDNWPYKGDYDLNDVVVKYDSKLHLNYEYDYNAIEETYTFLNNGGQYKNGFGIEYGFDRSVLDMERCTFEVTTPDGTTLAAPAFDEELERATLMLFEDAAAVPQFTEFRVTLVFRTPQLAWGFVLPPYNPFITVNDKGGLRKEVHLVDHKPTPKADPALLHFGDDLSGEGRYYVSSARYPFALGLTGADEYRLPNEKQGIGEAYPRFDSWVASGGTKDTDWYFD